MASCGSGILKLILGIINLVFLIIGAGIVFIGYKLIDWSKIDKVANINFHSVSIIIFIIGGAIIVIAGLGFLGACCESSIFLNTYGFLLILLIAGEIYIVYTVHKNGDIEAEIRNGIKKAIAEINTNNQTAIYLQEFQSFFKCCGVEGYKDFPENSILGSCCGKKEDTARCSLPEAENDKIQGCGKILSDLKTYLGSTTGVSIAAGLVQLVLVFAACCLARDFR